MVTRVYLAGPMTGIPQFNIPQFDLVAAQLRESGYEVVSPAELDDPEIRRISLASPDGAIATLNTHGQTWGDFLARDVKLLADDGIDAVAVLPGWRTSRGARLETFVAGALCGLRIMYVAYDYDGAYLRPVPPLALYRAWCEEPTLAIHGHMQGGKSNA